MRRCDEFLISPEELRGHCNGRPAIFFSHPLGVLTLRMLAEAGWSLSFRMKVPTAHVVKVRPKILFCKKSDTHGIFHRMGVKMKAVYAPPASAAAVIDLLAEHPVVFSAGQASFGRLSLDDMLAHFGEAEVLAALSARIRGRLRKRPRRAAPELGNVVSLLERLERRPRPRLDDRRVERALANQ